MYHQVFYCWYQALWGDSRAYTDGEQLRGMAADEVDEYFVGITIDRLSNIKVRDVLEHLL